MQTKFVSPDNPEKFILIDRNRLWENVRIFYEDKLVQSYKYATETREGAKFDIEGLGTVFLKVHAVTLHPTLTVNGEDYLLDGNVKSANKRLLVPVLTFGLLSALNIAYFISAITRFMDRPDHFFFQFVFYTSIFYMVSYLVSTIFLARRVYFFYFYGTAIFVISTLYVFAMFAFYPPDVFGSIFLLIRFLTLGLLLRYFKRAIHLFQNRNVSYLDQDVIDNKLDR